MKDIVSASNAKFMMILAMSIFGTIGVITHFIDLPASVIVLGRGVFGSITLLVIVYLTGSRLSKEDIFGNAFTLICSGICLGLNWLFLFEAYKSIEISVATVCNYLTPALVILVTPIFLKQKLTLAKLGCALLALFGLVLVSGILENGTLGADAYGIVCGVLAAVFYTAMVILNKKLKSIGSYDRTFVQLLIAAIVILIYCTVTVDFGSLTFDTMSIGLVILLGILQTAIAFTLYFGSLAYLDAPSAVVLGYIEPILGILLSVVILGEDLGIVGWIGAAVILGSTLIPELLEIRKRKNACEE
ncbi:MAG: EamA family transporter [Candidatus Methanomethylophilaceae archaeon]|nr:EamA family transporter [Candidatus Methanomethylophilaceae archaeon]